MRRKKLARGINTIPIPKIKQCARCKEHKKGNEFAYDLRRASGIDSYCKDCRSELTREKYYEIRDFTDSYKTKYGCMLCGERVPYLLEFHHKDPEFKEDCIGNMRSIDKIKEEIKKCVVLCKNCHANVHYWLNVNFGKIPAPIIRAEPIKQQKITLVDFIEV